MEYRQFILLLNVIGIVEIEALLILGALCMYGGIRQLLRVEAEKEMHGKSKKLGIGIGLSAGSMNVYLGMLLKFSELGWNVGYWVTLLSGMLLYTAATGKALKADMMCRESAVRRALEAARDLQMRLQEKETQYAPEAMECALVESSYVTQAIAQRVLEHMQKTQEPTALQFEREWVTITCGVTQRSIAVYADCFKLQRKAEPYYDRLETQQARRMLMQRVAAHLAQDAALCVMEMKTDETGLVVFRR